VGSTLAVDPAVVVRKYAASVGDGSSSSIAVTHNLATRDVSVQVYDAASYATVEVDVMRTDINAVTLNFASAPAPNAYIVVIHG
jgi:hypothetical protein